MCSVRIAGYQDEGITGAGDSTVVPFSQAPWVTHKSNLEVPDFVCREEKCPAWSMLPMLGPGCDSRDRDDGSAGGDGRAKPVTGTRLTAHRESHSWVHLRGNEEPWQCWQVRLRTGAGHWGDGWECVRCFDGDK